MSHHFTTSQDYEQFRQDNPDADMRIHKGKREYLPWLKAKKPIKNVFGAWRGEDELKNKQNEEIHTDTK